MRRLLAALLLSLAACGGGGGGAGSTTENPPPPPPPPPPALSADITLLFMGNSHTSFHDLPGMVVAMVRSMRPGKSVEHAVAPGWMFLEQRATDAAALQLLRSREWTYVVLQAQEYSSSGQFLYPIDGALALVRMARADKALPILFPEWPRRGIDETQRIFNLHVSIAQREPACVAPIPQAFDLAASRDAQRVLHESDGNHSSPAGAFLAALVIATTMTGVAPTAVPFLEGFGVEAGEQAALRAVAAETVVAWPPRRCCPADPYPLLPAA